MGFTIDIDTGGTFTDGFISDGNRFEKIKVDTTPHDLTVCFSNCITEGAKMFDVSPSHLLRDTSVLRYSTTVGTNALIQRTGTRIGLLVTQGAEDHLYERNSSTLLLEFLVERDMVLGIDGKINQEGIVEKEIRQDDVQKAAKKLLERGARIIVVSLHNAYYNPEHELQIKQWIQQDFPKHYLGSIPVFLASEFSRSREDFVRTNSTVINAYLHKDMVRYLYKAEDDLRENGLSRPLLIGHSSGGAARVAKTKALDTFNSGPVAGMLGSQYIAKKLYNLHNVVTFDVGGTSTDIGLITNGTIPYNEQPNIHELPVDIPLLKVETIGAGGGTIAKVKKGALQVGPNSAGAVPGPACFGLGGEDPTTTDAFVSLGFIDPEYFLGGSKQLDKDKADKAIQSIASQMGIGIVQAASLILEKLRKLVADEIYKVISPNGLKSEECALFSYGGAGGLLSAHVADRLGIQTIYTFPFSSVFSAFGSSTLDILHIYDSACNVNLNSYEAKDVEQIRTFLKKMKQQALRDMRGEGFHPEQVQFQIEWNLWDTEGQKQAIRLTSFPEPEDSLQVEEALAELSAQSQYSVIEGLRLKGISAVPHYDFILHEESAENVSKMARKGSRHIYWVQELQETNIYERSFLIPGNRIIGPAVIESNDSTYLVPNGWEYRIDRFDNGILEKVSF